MKKRSIYAGMLALVVSHGVAQASEPSDVSITGRIIPTPAAQCAATLSPSTVDFGAITHLNRDAPTPLDPKPFHLDVNCDVPVHLIVRFFDHKQDDAVIPSRHPACKDDNNIYAICDWSVFGLGKNTRGEKIGAMHLLNATDGKSAAWIPMDIPSDTKPVESKNMGFLTGKKDMEAFWMKKDAPFYPVTGRPWIKHFEYLADIPGACCDHPGQQHYRLPFLVAPIIDSEHLSVDSDTNIDGAFTMELHIL